MDTQTSNVHRQRSLFTLSTLSSSIITLDRLNHKYAYVWFQVRDRATLYLKQLGGEAGGPSGLGQQLDVSLVGFERQLQEYLAAGTTDRVFDVVSRQDLLGAGESVLVFCFATI